jgi:hypothetical protein
MISDSLAGFPLLGSEAVKFPALRIRPVKAALGMRGEDVASDVYDISKKGQPRRLSLRELF